MNKRKYEKIITLLCTEEYTKFYYKDFLIEFGSGNGLYFMNHYILSYDELMSALIMIDVLKSDSFTKRCFEKQEVPFIHSEIFRDGYF